MFRLWCRMMAREWLPKSATSCSNRFFTTEKGGTGLGLYVARELAHANLGQLHYHPELNGFELILPKDNNHEE